MVEGSEHIACMMERNEYPLICLGRFFVSLHVYLQTTQNRAFGCILGAGQGFSYQKS